MTNHNQLPATTPELSAEERAVLSAAKLNEWRSRQYSILNGLREAGNFSNPDCIEAFYDSVDGSLDDFLQEQGVDASSPNYDEVRALFYDARIGTDNGDGISEDAWGNSPASRGLDPNDHKSQSDLFKERIDQRLQSTSDNSTPAERTREQWEEHATDYEEYAQLLTNRDTWATESAKRQGRAFSLKKNEKRNEIKDKYHESVRAFGIKELEGQISEDDSDTEKNAKVIAWLFEEQAKLRELTTEKLKSTRTSKFVEWMNRGGTLKRIGKSALVGVAASGAAAGISLVAGFGLVAGAAGGAAAGAVGFGRFARGFAKGDRQRGMKTAQESFIDDDRQVELEDTERDSLSKRFDDAAVHYNEGFEEDTKLEQKKRRRAVVRGLTNVALGVGVGAAVHYTTDFFSTDDGELPSSRPDSDKPGLWGADGDRDGDGIVNHLDPDKDNDGVLNADDVKPLNPDVSTSSGDNILDFSEVSHDARWVDPGEGWYQTFKELGIPQDHWNDVLENAGPKLHDQGWAYFDESANEWRISQPGRLPDDSLRVIAKAASRDGFDLAA